MPELLRASHIKPRGRLRHGRGAPQYLYNGQLLAPHLDAAFDAGFLTDAEYGTVLLPDALPPEARSALWLDGSLKVRGLHRVHRAHERYLPWRRPRIFRTGAT